MEKRLPFQIIEGNMGSQYHHYLLGIILQDEKNWNFVYNNYIGMMVKHFFDSHGDFCFDGIYSSNQRIMNQMIIRGPIKNIQETITRCIDKGAYVIINLNEFNLPYRQVYMHHYFRHDLIIYGYDKETEMYITAGFDEAMDFCEKKYSYKEVERAYCTMQNEWDFEFFVFKWNQSYYEELNLSRVKQELQYYIYGENSNGLELDKFLSGGNDTYFVNNSYKDYYGIQLYDYLIDRIKGQNRLFLRKNSNDEIGVNDMRTINALRAHVWIISNLIQFVDGGEDKTKLEEDLAKVSQSLYVAMLLMMKYVCEPDRKGGKKLIRLLTKVKEEEEQVAGNILCMLIETL